MKEFSKDLYLAIEKKDETSKLSIDQIASEFDMPRRLAESYRGLLDNQDILRDIYGDTKLAFQKQRFQDLATKDRKTARDIIRMSNSIEAYNKALCETIDASTFNISKFDNPVKITKGNEAIIQIADPHFNEIVNLDSNSYDFEIASKRLSLYANKIKRQLNAHNVKKVTLAMTGDMLNSDRRLDEMLSMATNRAKATQIAVSLMQYFIADIITAVDEMDVVFVVGNESRAFELGWIDMVASDNYDSTIFYILERIFRKSNNVNFLDTDNLETVLSINGKNILVIHGHSSSVGKGDQKSLQSLYGKYATEKGIILNYAIFGHIHSANVTDLFARSGSLVGSNAYSDRALGFSSKASQNLTLILEDGTIDNVRLELQNVDNIEGYPIGDDLNYYNAKSSLKTQRKYKTIEVR